MKIRTGFVSNSSSSSFIVGVKGIDEKIDGAPEEWKSLARFAKTLLDEVYRGESASTVEQLQKIFYSRYGYGGKSFEKLLEEEGDWLQKPYTGAKEAIEEGYTVYFLELDYDDTLANNMGAIIDGKTFIHIWEGG